MTDADFDLWIDHTDWFKGNKHKVKPGVKQHKVQCVSDETWLVTKFCERHLSRGVSKSELKNLWNSDYSEDQVLLEEYRCLQEKTANSRFNHFWQTCGNPKNFDESNMVPFDQPLSVGFDRREPCNSPNFDGCICPDKGSWSDAEDEDFMHHW